MDSRRTEIVVIAGLLAATLVFGFFIIPAAIGLSFNTGGTGLSPRFMPQIATAGIALALAYGFVLLALTKGSDNAEPSIGSTTDRHPLRALGVVLICLLFAFLGFSVGGFYLGGIAMAFFLTLLLGERKVHNVVLVPILILASIYVVFELGLQIRLPKADIFPGLPI